MVIKNLFTNKKSFVVKHFGSSTQDCLAPLWFSFITKTNCTWIWTGNIVISTSDCPSINILTTLSKNTDFIFLRTLRSCNKEPFTRHSKKVVCEYWLEPLYMTFPHELIGSVVYLAVTSRYVKSRNRMGAEKYSCYVNLSRFSNTRSPLSELDFEKRRDSNKPYRV